MVSDPRSTITCASRPSSGIEDALEQFLLQLRADGRSEHTVLQYRRHVLCFIRWLVAAGEAAELRALDPQVLARFMVSTEAKTRPDGKPKKATAVNSLRSSLRGFSSYLHAAGLVQANPARLLRRAICSSRSSRALDEAEVERLMALLGGAVDAPGQRDRVLFTLMLSTGIRIGSALGLDVEDVDLERGELLLRRTKGSRVDRVFLPEVAVKVMADLVAEVAAGPVFRNGRGDRLTARHANRRLAEAFKRAGIRRVSGTHVLRHSFAQDLYGRTGDVLLVKEALCHRSVVSTLVYAQSDELKIRTAVGCKPPS